MVEEVLDAGFGGLRAVLLNGFYEGALSDNIAVAVHIAEGGKIAGHDAFFVVNVFDLMPEVFVLINLLHPDALNAPTMTESK